MTDRQAPLSELTDVELVRAVLDELPKREAFASVSSEVVALLSMGPTLTAVTDAGLQSPVDTAVRKGQELLARQSLILSEPMFTSREVAQAVGAQGAGHRSTAPRLRNRGDVIGLSVQGRYLYPAFQFDAQRAIVQPLVAEVNHLLKVADRPWWAAAWWLSPGLSDGRRPIDLLSSRSRLLALAADSDPDAAAGSSHRELA